MFFLLLALFTPPSFAAAPPAPGSHCAKMNLAAIYTGEKSHYAEYERYSEALSDIGYEQFDERCKGWEPSVRVLGNGHEFLATFTNRSTGETWEINGKKELRQTQKGRDN